MQFKIFNMNSNLNNQIEQAGFKVNSYEEISSYAFVNRQDNQLINNMLVPKDYKLDGSVWKEFQLPAYYERLFCLMRYPELSFYQLWDLYMITSNQDEEIGSLSLILSKYNEKLLLKVNEILHSNSHINKQTRKKLQNISKTIKSVEESIFTKQIVDILKITALLL